MTSTMVHVVIDDDEGRVGVSDDTTRVRFGDVTLIWAGENHRARAASTLHRLAEQLGDEVTGGA